MPVLLPSHLPSQPHFLLQGGTLARAKVLWLQRRASVLSLTLLAASGCLAPLPFAACIVFEGYVHLLYWQVHLFFTLLRAVSSTSWHQETVLSLWLWGGVEWGGEPYHRPVFPGESLHF